jgi:transmembrane sensor
MAGSIVMDPRKRRRRASEEAAAWWTSLQSEAVPRAEREQFVDWLRESPLHVAEFLWMAQVHDALKQYQRWNQVDTGDLRVNT